MSNLVDLHIMNLTLTMIDSSTGEILARSNKNYALSFATKNDAGFRYLMEWVMSSVRGIRCAHHDSIELRINFVEDKPLPQLPFGLTPEEARKQAAAYVY